MKSYIKYLVCALLLMLNGSHYARMLDVLILNGNGERGAGREFGAVEVYFARGVCQQVPMIASAALVTRYVERAHDAKIMTSLSDATWEMYENKQKSLYLFLPATYIHRIEKQAGTPVSKKQVAQKQTTKYEAYTAREILFGFAFSKLTPVTIDQLQQEQAFSNDEHHRKKNKRDQEMFVADIQDIMLPEKENIFGLWNIILVGHGSSVDQKEKTTSKVALQTSDNKAYIAGLSIAQYSNLLQFLTQKVNTNILFITTCHGGDFNLILPYVNILLNDKETVVGGLAQLDFTVAVGATTSASVFLENSKDEDFYVCAAKVWTTWPDMDSFFSLVHRYGNEQTARRILYDNKQIKEILAAMSRDTRRLKLAKIPQVRFPGTDVFRAVAVDDTISVLSEVVVRQHVYEQQPFVLKDQTAILLYPRIIPAELIIERKKVAYYPMVMSMQPGIGLHCIKQVTTTMSSSEFLSKPFAQITPLFPKYYYIEKLTTKELSSGVDKVYTDVFITTASVPSYFQSFSAVKILFTQQGADKGTQEIYQWNIQCADTGDICDIPRPVFLENRGKTYIPDNPFLNALYTYFKSLEGREELSESFNIDKLYPILTPKEQKQLMTSVVADTSKKL